MHNTDNTMKPKALLLAIQKHRLWQRCIGPWLKGKAIGDAPKHSGRKGRCPRIYVSPSEVRFIGPFAEVSASLTDKPGEWLAVVSYCANPARQYFTDRNKLIECFCGSVWHVAIRGVI
jgi:hypothetical protein